MLQIVVVVFFISGKTSIFSYFFFMFDNPCINEKLGKQKLNPKQKPKKKLNKVLLIFLIRMSKVLSLFYFFFFLFLI